MKNRKMFYATLLVIGLVIMLLFEVCSPVREFMTWKPYQGKNDFLYEKPVYDSLKKTVIIVADNEGTEIFDMLTPFYLFNKTQKANVYIVAQNNYPIIVRKGFYLLPQFTFAAFDSTKISPDVIIMPNLSAMDAKHQNPQIVNWIKKHYTANVKMLSVCDGSLTAAATGIYDGKPITTHASDYEVIKGQFDKPIWVKNVSVTDSGNIFSTAGVSNAVEGSLLVIKELFDEATMTEVLKHINYPHLQPKIEHQSNAISFGDKLRIGKKVIFKRNRKVGVLLQNEINEFELAAIMDTYNRTFPKSIESYTISNATVRTQHGLTIIPTGKLENATLDELHVINPLLFSKIDEAIFNKTEIIKYNNLQKNYIINVCLERIRGQYGEKYERIVRLLLDYN
jgi:transcriptional regulator GlxA family with amidase domain